MKKAFFITQAVMLTMIALTGLLYSCTSTKQVSQATPEEIRNAIAGDRWAFYAQYANPQSGRTRYLNSREYVYFSKDTLDSGLPYFGRAYSGADVMTNQSVLGFKSTDLTFTREKNKNDGWVITVKPKDYTQVQSYTFTLYENGSASLSVLLTNRSPISFTGSVAPR